MTLFANGYPARRSGTAQVQAGGDSLHQWLGITGCVMTHSVNQKNAQRAACGIRARSGSIKPIEIVLESSDGKHGAASEQANRGKRQKEPTNSPCTKGLGRCHEVKFSSRIRFAADPDAAPPASFPARVFFCRWRARQRERFRSGQA